MRNLALSSVVQLINPSGMTNKATFYSLACIRQLSTWHDMLDVDFRQSSPHNASFYRFSQLYSTRFTEINPAALTYDKNNIPLIEGDLITATIDIPQYGIKAGDLRKIVYVYGNAIYIDLVGGILSPLRFNTAYNPRLFTFADAPSTPCLSSRPIVSPNSTTPSVFPFHPPPPQLSPLTPTPGEIEPIPIINKADPHSWTLFNLSARRTLNDFLADE